MTPYPDGAFLLSLLIRTSESPQTHMVLREIAAPLLINQFHQLQAEHFLTKLAKSSAADLRKAGRTGKRLWPWYFAEGFFQQRQVDWESALQLAIKFNSGYQGVPPPPLLLLHPALAVVMGATHFLSFDPRSRAVAEFAQLKLLPEKL